MYTLIISSDERAESHITALESLPSKSSPVNPELVPIIIFWLAPLVADIAVEV